MTWQQRIADLATELGTDYKAFRTFLTGGPTGELGGLNTVAQNVRGAINEVNAKVPPAPANASESVAGVAEIATLTEVATGTDSVRFVTPAGVRQERTALKAELLGGASAAWDTLNELATAVQAAEESDVITSLTTVVGTKANSADVYSKTAMGDIEADLVAVYNAAKSSA